MQPLFKDEKTMEPERLLLLAEIKIKRRK